MQKTEETHKIAGNFLGKDIISLDQFLADDLLLLFSKVPEMKKIVDSKKPSDILAGIIVTLLFYEPSSRTFASFDAAVKRLGGQTTTIQNPQQIASVAKGESLEDTIHTLESYADAIVMRHPDAGSAKKAADAATIPVFNAGDGASHHPTQGLLDLYTLYNHFGRLENLTGVLTGDILHSRTHHSVIQGLSIFPKNTLYLLSPEELRLTRADFSYFTKQGITLIEIHHEKDIPKNANFWYWNRIQKERFTDETEAQKYKDKFILTVDLLKKYGNDQMIIMDPLPRVGEIESHVDPDPRAVYLRLQMRHGVYIRMALLGKVLGRL